MPDGRLAAAGGYVLLARTMAAFAVGLLRRPVARRHGLIVRILIEVRPYVRVTGFTCVTAHVRCGGWRRLRQTKGRYREEYKDGDTYPLSSEHVSSIHTYCAGKLL